MKIAVFFLLCFLFAGRLVAESSVWKISDGVHVMYIGGTIHLLRPSDYPLPVEFDRAYDLADYIVFETDPVAVNSEDFASKLVKKMILPSGKKLADYLTPGTYRKFTMYLARNDYPITMFERLKPWGVMLTLTQLQLSRYGIDQSGVDAYYSAKASGEGKPCRFLETPDEQIALISGIGEGEEDSMILQTLDEITTMPQMMEWLLSDWRGGKTERIRAELVEPMAKESPLMYRRILSQRNRAWMPKLIAMLHEKKTGFVMVGTMHLVGEDGLLAQLRRHGFTVEPFRR